ncbi:beta-ketoacyl synthase [Thalassotalea sp. 1_MG-2023]|uniref:beta-ketoacyl synthase n=1 Tax=Thalassotalea sp. 1_MG-2023 TaxID=3062680 RepID=UPI0026E4547F|nr:beta-ketoacyl synthase [Thalassotalea sp. 1_MG-2023]MDO6428182.1 beta-ketoacyl synthase [Thalassotalea sp. 1_MG-2023]
MTSLPVIVGMGGINAAGRTSFHQGFRRIILDKLSEEARQETFVGLATLMNLVSFKDGLYVDHLGEAIASNSIEARYGEKILAGTLIRKIESNHFDPDATPWQQKIALQAESNGLAFTAKKRDLPRPIPSTWQVSEIDEKNVKVFIEGTLEVKHDSTRDNPIKAAGQFPTGFNPAVLYNSRYQPRGLQATIFGAADAIHSTGYSWPELAKHVSPDEIGTYSASVFGQMQAEGLGGMTQNRLKGERVTTKNLALGLNTMSTDFINAYVTGSVGTTFTSTGACATFLYNLKAAVNDIQSGRIRLAIVGSNDCALTPEVIEGFGNMSALANEEGLKKLDGITEGEANHRRTSRPFGDNCGFTIGEAAQFLVLMDDKLALELGAKVLGSVADVYTNADGIKKSITAPGPGNYITMAKSVALAKSIVGEEAVQQRSFILAHGSSTPQNRVTESLIYHRIAESFDINQWPVAAPKAYLGHTIGPASGDQVAWALGVFEYNIMPGITTINAVADDVHDERLNISTEHWQCHEMDVAFINSKGFGGNNATATLLSPKVTLSMMAKRYGNEALSTYHDKLIEVEQAREQYQDKADKGQFELIYKFGDGVLSDDDIDISKDEIAMSGMTQTISLPKANPFSDMV